MALLHVILYYVFFDQVVSNWIILKGSTHYFDNDWNDINRKWTQIKHFHTANGNNIKRKCTIYFDGNQLCLCQFLDNIFYPNIQHLCFHQHPSYSFPTLLIVDSFPNRIHKNVNNGDTVIASAIKHGLDFYLQRFTNNKKLPIDSIFLLKLIAKNDIFYRKIANLYFHKLQNNKKDSNNPFFRVFSKRNTQRFKDLKFIRSHSHNSYVLNRKYAKYNVDPTDDIVLKALFCDIDGFDQIDFDILTQNMANYNGGYEDTHSIIALNFLAVNKCYDANKIHYAMAETAQAILLSLYDNTSALGFGDLFFERIVCLYWSGYGDHIKKEWIIKIAKYQSKTDYGWSHDYEIQDSSTPHPTGLALLAMIYYEIGDSKQLFYPIDSL